MDVDCETYPGGHELTNAALTDSLALFRRAIKAEPGRH